MGVRFQNQDVECVVSNVLGVADSDSLRFLVSRRSGLILNKRQEDTLLSFQREWNERNSVCVCVCLGVGAYLPSAAQTLNSVNLSCERLTIEKLKDNVTSSHCTQYTWIYTIPSFL